MPVKNKPGLRLSDSDLDFLINVAAHEVEDKVNLKRILRQDNDFCRTFVEDERVFQKMMDDDQIFLKISPILFFEILLRTAAKELAKLSYTLEKNRNMSIPVFDTEDILDFLDESSVVIYLADMY